MNATCIGCGCHDEHACVNERTQRPCGWLAVDYAAGVGVCSECPGHMARWNAGDRAKHAKRKDDVMLVAKITRQGDPAAPAEPFYLEANDIGSFTTMLEVGAGDRFIVEWERMTTSEFEALPQFAYLRQAREWIQRWNDAARAKAAGDAARARELRETADRIESQLAAEGHNVRWLAEQILECKVSGQPA